MNWSEMSPRERDALVAEKVMGFTKPSLGWGFHELESGSYVNYPLPHYTTDISEVWEVVDKLKKKRVFINMGFSPISNRYAVNFSTVTVMKDSNGYAPTAPEAICLAALKAVGVEI